MSDRKAKTFSSARHSAYIRQQTHVREDIESQRDIYDSDRKADGVNLKRTLREGLRDERFSSTVDKLSEREVGALQNAINLVSTRSRTKHDT